jgi:flavodoxin
MKAVVIYESMYGNTHRIASGEQLGIELVTS